MSLCIIVLFSVNSVHETMPKLMKYNNTKIAASSEHAGSGWETKV